MSFSNGITSALLQHVSFNLFGFGQGVLKTQRRPRPQRNCPKPHAKGVASWRRFYSVLASLAWHRWRDRGRRRRGDADRTGGDGHSSWSFQQAYDWRAVFRISLVA